ncbi:hypothetical protein E2C01_031358 [Portunus trituberculatus]|uniref:Uncharacterized protein n=1 Tax=Portunus trituberculatus TaxID=210409 RepID=A0A5B7EYC9_PORTR|nr:hypothetical protein [Portunus trituberculatus]
MKRYASDKPIHALPDCIVLCEALGKRTHDLDGERRRGGGGGGREGRGKFRHLLVTLVRQNKRSKAATWCLFERPGYPVHPVAVSAADPGPEATLCGVLTSLGDRPGRERWKARWRRWRGDVEEGSSSGPLYPNNSSYFHLVKKRVFGTVAEADS